jgi:kanamycin kinase
LAPGVGDLVPAVAGATTRLVWRNEAGGETYEIAGPPRRFLKWSPASSGIDLGDEATRLRWARAFVAVPEVVDTAGDARGTWLLTEALPGRNAVDPRWRERPAATVRAVGEGLRAFHEALPVESCPFTWAVGDRVAAARHHADTGLMDPASFHVEHRRLAVDEVLALLAEPPPPDRAVVCHADACLPNSLLHDDGRVAGHVDLGRTGVADRWADLAVATWSATWNLGPGWEAELLAAYGVAPDTERSAYYRLLWDASP